MQAMNEALNKFYNSKRFNLIAFGLIAALTIIAYSNTFTASFHFDDHPAILENSSIRYVTMDNILDILKTTRPVVNLTLMLNYQLSGLNVVGWHIFNIGNHIANSYLVYLLILWTLTLPALAAKFGEKAKRMALLGALLFAVHPIQTESVTYIISRSETVASFFYLSAMLLFIKGARTEKFYYYICAFFSSLLAMGSKEWAATLPAMILLYDFIFLSGSNLKQVMVRWKAYALMMLPWLAIAKILTLHKGSSGIGFSVVTTTGITPVTYLLTSFNVLWTYVRLLFLPIGQNLDYDYPIAKTLFEFPTLLSFIGHIAVVSICFWLYKKRGWLLVPFGAAWFYITISPTQSFVPIIDVIFEHRLYLPSIGFFLVFITLYEEFFEWLDARKV